MDFPGELVAPFPQGYKRSGGASYLGRKSLDPFTQGNVAAREAGVVSDVRRPFCRVRQVELASKPRVVIKGSLVHGSPCSLVCWMDRSRKAADVGMIWYVIVTVESDGI